MPREQKTGKVQCPSTENMKNEKISLTYKTQKNVKYMNEHICLYYSEHKIHYYQSEGKMYRRACLLRVTFKCERVSQSLAILLLISENMSMQQ